MRYLLLFVFLIELPLNAGAVDVVAINKSPTVLSILQQADETYMLPFKTTIRGDQKHNIISLAIVMGLTMQSQLRHKEQNPQYAPQFELLKKDMLSFLAQVAVATNNSNPPDGKYIDGDSLAKAFAAGLDGRLDQGITKSMGINPKQVRLPSILERVVVVPPTGSDRNFVPLEPLARFGIEEDAIEIKLLGEVAGPAISDPDDPSQLSHSAAKGNGPYLSELICPRRHPNNTRNLLYLDTNNNSEDKTQVVCYYSNSTGDLDHQNPEVDGVRHGVSLRFRSDTNGEYYALRERTPYTNGNIHGVKQSYGFFEGIYTEMDRKEYVDGMLIRHDDFDACHDKGYCLDATTLYVNGNKTEVIFYYWGGGQGSGHKSRHVTVNDDGSYTSDACWDKNGTNIPCQ